jgi:hypothetical protein
MEKQMAREYVCLSSSPKQQESLIDKIPHTEAIRLKTGSTELN